jgi:hypothetical protein
MPFEKQHFVIGNNRNLSQSDKHLEDRKSVSTAYNDGADHIETMKPLEKTPSRVKKARDSCQRHWRRFWCIYAIASIIFLAIFLPVL